MIGKSTTLGLNKWFLPSIGMAVVLGFLSLTANAAKIAYTSGNGQNLRNNPYPRAYRICTFQTGDTIRIAGKARRSWYLVETVASKSCGKYRGYVHESIFTFSKPNSSRKNLEARSERSKNAVVKVGSPAWATGEGRYLRMRNSVRADDICELDIDDKVQVEWRKGSWFFVRAEKSEKCEGKAGYAHKTVLTGSAPEQDDPIDQDSQSDQSQSDRDSTDDSEKEAELSEEEAQENDNQKEADQAKESQGAKESQMKEEPSKEANRQQTMYRAPVPLLIGDNVDEQVPFRCKKFSVDSLRSVRVSAFYSTQKDVSWFENLRDDSELGKDTIDKKLPVFSLVQLHSFGKTKFRKVEVLARNNIKDKLATVAADSIAKSGDKGYLHHRSLTLIDDFVIEILSDNSLQGNFLKINKKNRKYSVIECTNNKTYLVFDLYESLTSNKDQVAVALGDFGERVQVRVHPVKEKKGKLQFSDKADFIEDLNEGTDNGPKYVDSQIAASELDAAIERYSNSKQVSRMLTYMWGRKFGRAQGRCAEYTREGMQYAGILNHHPGINYARDYHPYMSTIGFTNIYDKNKYPKWHEKLQDDFFNVPNGCIAIYDGIVDKYDRNGPVGHIEARIKQGTWGFISDYFKTYPRTGYKCEKWGRERYAHRSFRSRTSSRFRGKRISVKIKFRKCVQHDTSKGAYISDAYDNRVVRAVYCKL